MSYLAQQLKMVKPGNIGLEHGSLTFTGDPKFKYEITSGFYDGYPILTDNLYGALVTLFGEIQDYIDDLYKDNTLDDSRRYDLIADALALSVNGEDIEVDESDLSCDANELLVPGLEIHDICGRNFGSGLYIAE